MDKEVVSKIVAVLEEAEEFYVPVKKLWKELASQGYGLPLYDTFLEYLTKDRRFEVKEFEAIKYEDSEEMEELGFYSGPRVKLKTRKMTKEDIQRITLKHAQNMIDNLVKAYEARPEGLPSEGEDELIELMRKAKMLKDKMEDAFGEGDER